MVTTISDCEEIRNLNARYAMYVDLGRAADWAMLFAEEGELVMPGEHGDLRITGRADLEEFAARAPSGRHHFIVNELIDVVGDRATATASFLVTQNDPLKVFATGRYADELVKERGQWRFRSRAVRDMIRA